MEILSIKDLNLHNLWGLALAYSGLVLGIGKFRDAELGNYVLSSNS